MTSHLLPTFVARLADPQIRTVLLCGCGGGFDFVHSLALYPELRRLGKKVVIGSYSFGNPEKISGAVPFFSEDGAVAVLATANNVADAYYGPEVHVCSYLDSVHPDSGSHSVYAYYARAFTVRTLSMLYQKLIAAHSIDAIVIVDGGSDSLMVGVPSQLESRVRPGELFFWPLMAVLWGFDVETVARRSLIGGWIRDCSNVQDCYQALHRGRRWLGAKLRGVENLPQHEEMRRKR